MHAISVSSLRRIAESHGSVKALGLGGVNVGGGVFKRAYRSATEETSPLVTHISTLL